MAKHFTQEDLDFVFGLDSSGLTPEARAITSHQEFVRGQDQIARDNPEATGLRMSAKKALSAYGFDMLLEICEQGAVALAHSADEPMSTIRQRRVALGLSHEQLAEKTGMALSIIADAEDVSKYNSIHDLVKIAEVLGLDPLLLSWKPGALARR